MSQRLKLLIFLICLIGAFITKAADAHLNLRWNDRNVEVCWANAEIFKQILKPFMSFENVDSLGVESVSRKNKNHIKKTVNLHFQSEITGINFTGWKECFAGSTAVKIFYFDELGGDFKKLDEATFGLLSIFTNNYLGVSSIGNASFANNEMTEPGRAGTQALLLRTLNPGTILHEFGHLSGLRHEHIKPDVYHGEICREYTYLINENFKAQTERKLGAESITVPDQFSIMSYCYIKLWKSLRLFSDYDLSEKINIPFPEYIKEHNGKFLYQTLLSLSDIHTLRCLYTEENDEHYCREHITVNDKYALKVYKKYLKQVTSSESQSIYEYRTLESPSE